MSFTRSSPDGRELGVEAYLRELRVGRCLLVHYGDEPGVYMERVLLWPASGPNSRGVWAVRTPDDDIYPEDVTGGSPDDGPDKVVLLNKHCSGPRSLRGRMYRFSTYWDWDELKAFVEMGRACLRADGYALASPPDEVWFEGVPRTIGAVLGLALPRVSLPVREPLGGRDHPASTARGWATARGMRPWDQYAVTSLSKGVPMVPRLGSLDGDLRLVSLPSVQVVRASDVQRRRLPRLCLHWC